MMTVKFQKPKKPVTSQGTFIRLPDELRDWIAVQCEREDRNISSMIRILIIEAKNARERKPV